MSGFLGLLLFSSMLLSGFTHGDYFEQPGCAPGAPATFATDRTATRGNRPTLHVHLPPSVRPGHPANNCLHGSILGATTKALTPGIYEISAYFRAGNIDAVWAFQPYADADDGHTRQQAVFHFRTGIAQGVDHPAWRVDGAPAGFYIFTTVNGVADRPVRVSSMPRVKRGEWVHVKGTFDLARHRYVSMSIRTRRGYHTVGLTKYALVQRPTSGTAFFSPHLSMATMPNAPTIDYWWAEPRLRKR